MSAIPTKNRQIVDERDQGTCVRCGGRATDKHHRQRRREGGHAPSILISLCRTDHKWAHANPEEARRTGYIISVYEQEPELVPIDTFMGKVLFDNQGGTHWV